MKYAIVHCSDSPWGTEKMIDVWHKKRGFKSCGYHFIILNGRLNSRLTIKALDGAVCPSRPIGETGAHCYGYNRDSIGICLIGKNTFTGAQFVSLKKLIDELKTRYPRIAIHSHKFFNSNKTCPNFELSSVINYSW